MCNERENLEAAAARLVRSRLETLDAPSTPLTGQDFQGTQREGDAEIARRLRARIAGDRPSSG
jgi:hypothetical protein